MKGRGPATLGLHWSSLSLRTAGPGIFLPTYHRRAIPSSCRRTSQASLFSHSHPLSRLHIVPILQMAKWWFRELRNLPQITQPGLSDASTSAHVPASLFPLSLS